MDLLKNDQLHDVIEYPWKRCYIAFLRNSEKEDMLKKNYIFSKEKNGFIRQNWERIYKRTLLDPFRMGKLIDLVIQTNNIPGDIVECGSFKGGSGILMGLLLKELGSDKKIHLFDSFEGLPEPDKKNDKGYKKGQFKSDFSELQAVIEQLDLSDTIFLHKGWFNVTIPQYLSNEPKVSLFHIDCDLYTSTMDCFPSVFPFVEEKGVVILDDFNDGGKGEKRAIVQTLTRLDRSETIVVGPASQAYFTKGKLQEGAIVKDGKIGYDIGEILANSGYLSWLKDNINENYQIKLNSLLKMEKQNLLSQISEIIKDVLLLDDFSIVETTSAEEVEEWDSINHVEIIAAIEDHFKVRFNTLEIETFKNVGDLVNGVNDKIKQQ